MKKPKSSVHTNFADDLALILENSRIVINDVSKDHIDRVHLAFDNAAKMVVGLKKIKLIVLSVKGAFDVLRMLKSMTLLGHKIKTVEWEKKSPIGAVKVISAEGKDISEMVGMLGDDLKECLHASGLPSFTLNFK